MREKLKHTLYILILLWLFICLVLVVGIYYYAKYLWNSPIDENGIHIVFKVKKGETFKDVVDRLKKQGILKDTKLFYLMGRLTKAENKIRSGEFLINTRWSQKRLLQYLISGPPYLHKVTIPPGEAWWSVGKLLEKKGILKFSDFKKVIFDREFLDKNNIPGPCAEGYLYPNTYFFEKGVDKQHAREVVEKMVDEFWREVKKHVWKKSLPESHEIYKIVILASLVEKEALYDFEKPIIAGVFLNRLKKNMRLQCDPTVIYGLGPGFRGNLRKKDLRDKDNPYNTYRYNGLPPTPICSPTVSSILAVVHPAKHSYLYFVSKGDGTHKFSTTLKEHNKAVYKYQIAPHRKNVNK